MGIVSCVALFLEWERCCGGGDSGGGCARAEGSEAMEPGPEVAARGVGATGKTLLGERRVLVGVLVLMRLWGIEWGAKMWC